VSETTDFEAAWSWNTCLLFIWQAGLPDCRLGQAGEIHFRFLGYHIINVINFEHFGILACFNALIIQ